MRRTLLIAAAALAAALLCWLGTGPGLDAPTPAVAPARAATATAEAGDPVDGTVPPRPTRAAHERREAEPPPGSAGRRGRLPPDPAVYGLVSRSGRPVAERDVHVLGHDWRGTIVFEATRTDSLGQYRTRIQGGQHSVRVVWDGLVAEPPPRLGKSGPRPPTAAAAVDVTVDEQPVPADLRLPPGAIHLILRRKADQTPVPDVPVRLLGPDALDLRGKVGRHGELHARDLPAGTWTLELDLRGFRAPPLPTIWITDQQPEQVLALDLEPAGALDLRLVDARGQPVPASAALRLEVVQGPAPDRRPPTNQAEIAGGRRPTVLRFDQLAAGGFTLETAAEAVTDDLGPAVCFQPIEILEPPTAQVTLGEVTSADLPVRYRTYARLRGGKAGGGLHRRATLRVDRLDPRAGVQRILPAAWQTGSTHGGAHFEGYLLPGSYLLTFTGPNGEVHRAPLEVTGQDKLDRAFTLPW